jgi:hypothetical protein
VLAGYPRHCGIQALDQHAPIGQRRQQVVASVLTVFFPGVLALTDVRAHSLQVQRRAGPVALDHLASATSQDPARRAVPQGDLGLTALSIAAQVALEDVAHQRHALGIQGAIEGVQRVDLVGRMARHAGAVPVDLASFRQPFPVPQAQACACQGRFSAFDLLALGLIAAPCAVRADAAVALQVGQGPSGQHERQGPGKEKHQRRLRPRADLARAHRQPVLSKQEQAGSQAREADKCKGQPFGEGAFARRKHVSSENRHNRSLVPNSIATKGGATPIGFRAERR